MSHYNNIEISGYAGLDGSSRVTSSGKGIATVRIGVGQGEGKPTMWLSIDAWQDSPAFAVVESVRKGQPLGVRGRLAMREWTDKDGNPRQSWQVTAQDAEFVQIPPRDERPRQPERPRDDRRQPAPARPEAGGDVWDDSDPLPF